MELNNVRMFCVKALTDAQTLELNESDLAELPSYRRAQEEDKKQRSRPKVDESNGGASQAPAYQGGSSSSSNNSDNNQQQQQQQQQGQQEGMSADDLLSDANADGRRPSGRPLRKYRR